MKYRLLQEPDWAAVSAARPLAITFAPVEETERFGKRRKLNDKDRKRLSAAYGSQSLPGLLKSRETEALWNGDLDRVKIRINGRPVGMHSSESPGVSASGLSSQSMLLDNEESTSSHRLGMAKDPWTQGPNRLSLQPSFGRAPPKFGSPLSPFPHTTAYEDLGSIQRKLTLVPGRRESANTSMEHHRPMISERSVTRSPSALDSPLPTRQHFTIDHQAFAEETGMLQKYVRQPSHEPPRSLMGTLGASPELLNTDALPDSPASSWLTQPQPQRLDASSNSNACRSRAAILTAANESSRSNFPRNPFIDMAESDHCSPTAKVFGQLVQIRSDCGADYE